MLSVCLGNYECESQLYTYRINSSVCSAVRPVPPKCRHEGLTCPVFGRGYQQHASWMTVPLSR